MAYFHYRCGERISLLNDNCTAVRSDSEFDYGLVISAEPLVNDVLFEIKIDRKVITYFHYPFTILIFNVTYISGEFMVGRFGNRCSRLRSTTF